MPNNVRIRASVDDKASKPLDRLRDKLSRIRKDGANSVLTGVGLGAGVTAFNAVGNAASKAVDFIGDAVQAASSLAESQSKVDVVFGESADEITKWSENSAEAFGQSQQAALEAAGTYGNLFQAFGVGREEATSMSKALVELAADLASFNNTSVDDALIALRSGLSGETEPLKRYGIAINDARMRTVLAAQGVHDLGATLTANQKAVGAYAIIMQDSALAQGDFARTSDGLANQQRILAARLADVQAEIGQKFLPIMLEATEVLNNDFVPALEGAIDGLEALSELGVWDTLGDAFQNTFVPQARVVAELTEELNHLERVSEASGAATASNWTAMGRAMLGVGSDAQAMAGAIDEATDEATKSVEEMTRDIADAMLKGQTDWQDAVENYAEFLEKNLMPQDEADQIVGQMEYFNAELLRAQQSGDAEWIAEVEATLAQLIASLYRNGALINAAWAAIWAELAAGQAQARALLGLTGLTPGADTPGAPGGFTPTPPMLPGGGSVPVTNNYNVTVQGGLIAKTPNEVVTALQRASRVLSTVA